MKKALITGVTGQDGSYLAELLLEKGYVVVGVTSGKASHKNLVSIEDRITWVIGNIADENFVRDVLKKHLPDEVYNLASVATVARPWDNISDIAHITGLAPLYFLEGIKNVHPSARFFQASSSQMFAPGKGRQDEETTLKPRNPYGIAKVFAHSMVGAYRKDQRLFAAAGILFNHESPRRGEDFLMRKITLSLAKINLGIEKEFSLGNLDARRDWGFAKDYVTAMHLMLQEKTPDDYVIATGETRSIRDVVEAACEELEIPLSWEGEDFKEIATSNGSTIIRIDKALYRPEKSDAPCGDSSKAQRELHWKPSVSFKELVRLMTRSDFELAQTMK